LDCPEYLSGFIHCPNEENKELVIQALKHGDMVLTAGPFNMQRFVYSCLFDGLFMFVCSFVHV